MWLPGSPGGKRLRWAGLGCGGGRNRRPALQTHMQTLWHLQAVDRCRGRMWVTWERVEGGDPGNTWRGGQDPPEVTLGYEEPPTQQLSLWEWGGARPEAGSCQANERILSGSLLGSQ